jgi:hypothetical protein
MQPKHRLRTPEHEPRAATSRPGRNDLLIISTDAKGIVMWGEDLRDASRQADEKSPQAGDAIDARRAEQPHANGAGGDGILHCSVPTERRAHHPRKPDEVDVRRPRLSDKRVWASVGKSPRAVIREAHAEALRRDPGKQRRWACSSTANRSSCARSRQRRMPSAFASTSSSISFACSSTSGTRLQTSSARPTPRRRLSAGGRLAANSTTRARPQ